MLCAAGARPGKGRGHGAEGRCQFRKTFAAQGDNLRAKRNHILFCELVILEPSMPAMGILFQVVVVPIYHSLFA